MSIKSILTAAALTIAFAGAASASDTIRIVGSSTVFPFTTAVAETFGKKTSYSTPVVESTGTGGGMKLFCGGIGLEHPDMTNASRPIKDTELKLCADNGVNDVIEMKVGYDGIVLANSKQGELMDITLQQLYLALAMEIPGESGVWIKNPHTKWSDIDPSLPDVKIEVLGPPPTSGTRDAFVELAMEGGCKTFEWVKKLKDTDSSVFKSKCHNLRQDGHFVEAGENDNLIIQKLKANENAYGIFGFGFLDQNTDTVQGSDIGGVEPTFEAIADGSYPISRSLFFYIKGEHMKYKPAIGEFVREYLSESASGDFGYLTDRGLIPLMPEEHSAQKAKIEALIK